MEEQVLNNDYTVAFILLSKRRFFVNMGTIWRNLYINHKGFCV